jgi:hypothetical protein
MMVAAAKLSMMDPAIKCLPAICRRVIAWADVIELGKKLIAQLRRWKRRSETIDKSVLAFPEPRRIRDRDHVRYVAKQPCLICDRQPSDAHHVRFAQSSALGRKVSDEFTVPLCRGHHREVHRCGDEPVWWLKVRINPMVKARELWLETHPPPVRDR